MNVLFIIEGVDGVGKTQLAQHIMDRMATPAAHLHAGKPTRRTMIGEYGMPVHQLGLNRYNVVCDRWHLGEFVWPTIFNREDIVRNGIESPEEAIETVENFMVQRFDIIVPIYVERSLADILNCRDIDYDFDRAVNLYERALMMSTWTNWVRGDLMDFLPYGELDHVIDSPLIEVNAE